MCQTAVGKRLFELYFLSMGVNHFHYLVSRTMSLFVDIFLRMIQLLSFQIPVALLLMVSTPSMYSPYVSAFVHS